MKSRLFKAIKLKKNTEDNQVDERSSARNKTITNI